MLRARLQALILAFILLALVPRAAFPAPNQDPSLLCAKEIQRVERSEGIPSRLLDAISVVESGRWDSEKKASFAWPWTVTAEGKGRFFRTKAEAIAEVKALKARGIRNIDVGCMQVNLHYHKDAFADLDMAMEPASNVAYAARFLKNLYADRKDWPAAAAAYHSNTESFARAYQAKVMAAWGEQRKMPTVATAALDLKQAKAAAPRVPQMTYVHRPQIKPDPAQEAKNDAARRRYAADREAAKVAAEAYRKAKLVEFQQRRALRRSTVAGAL